MQEPCPAAELLPQGWSCCSSSTTSSVTSSQFPAQHSRLCQAEEELLTHPSPSLPNKAFPAPQTRQMLKSHQLGGRGAVTATGSARGCVYSEMAWRSHSAPCREEHPAAHVWQWSRGLSLSLCGC